MPGRRRQRYGTLICDLEKRRVIDLLPDREPATVEAWLIRHPQIEVVARHQNRGYGRAVRQAPPKAVQLADRWHLLENSGRPSSPPSGARCPASACRLAHKNSIRRS
jgi:transposase